MGGGGGIGGRGRGAENARAYKSIKVGAIHIKIAVSTNAYVNINTIPIN